MRRNKLFVLIILGIFLIGLVSASGYVQTNRIQFQENQGSSFTNGPITLFDNQMCEEGQDFIVQIAPGSCSPAVVRSDLLEEQDVPVFCELQAIKVNPLVNIKAIDSMSFSHDGNPSVRTIGFQPLYDSLGKGRQLSEGMFNNIGSAVFILRQNVNESSMPDIIEGNIEARLMYDMENGFGLRRHTFYLPVLEDREFEERVGQYAFFDNRGYLRVEDVQDDSARFTIYSGRLQNPNIPGSTNLQRIQSYDLEEGKETTDILLPGLDCLSSVRFKLEDITTEDERAQLRINSDVIQVGENENFLNDKCRVTKDGITKEGLNQQVRMNCQTDNGGETFELRISPTVKLSVDGKEGTYKLGESVFSEGTDEFYLGYVGYKNGLLNENSELEAALVRIPRVNIGKNNMLTTSQLSNVYNLMEDKTLFGSFGKNVYAIGRYLLSGDNVFEIYQDGRTVGGKRVEIIELGGSDNTLIEGTNADKVLKYSELANEDLDYVFDNYEGEKYPVDNLESLSQEALFEKMQLAKTLEQKRDYAILCEEYGSIYPDAKLQDKDCFNAFYTSNYGISSRDILIDGDFKEITLERVNQPRYEDFGAEVRVQGPDKKIDILKFTKDKMYSLSEDGKQWMKLINVDEDSATFEMKIETTQKSLTGAGNVIKKLVTREYKIKKNDPSNYGSDFAFTVMDVNFERVAKITVKPTNKHQFTTANLSYAIGVEKRNIQLSPEMTKKLINKLNETIETWTSISKRLDTVVDFMGDACLATGTALNLKNLIWGIGGKTVARGEVMDYWKEKCNKEVLDGKYSSVDTCYYQNNDVINSEVDNLAEKMKEQDKRLKELQNVTRTTLIGERIVNTEQLEVDYAEKVSGKIASVDGGILSNKDGKTVNLALLVSELDKNGANQGVYDLEDLKALELYAELYEKAEDEYKDYYKEKLFRVASQVEKNAEHIIEVERSSKKIGAEPSRVVSLALNDNVREAFWQEETVLSIKWTNVPGLLAHDPVVRVQVPSGSYVIVLDDSQKTSQLPVKRINQVPQIYTMDKELVNDSKLVYTLSNNFKFLKYTEGTFRNPFVNNKDFVIKYYETEPYKGLPAFVPFDKKNGWYAYVDQTIPTFGEQRSYDQSGRIASFRLCNVGENGLAEADKGYGDDICQTINTQTSYVSTFGGLSKTESAKLIDTAVRAIYDASRQYKDGAGAIEVNGQKIQIGEPLVNMPAGECVDYMSPKDCKLLFNVCDPVICPATRCDFGGDYPVKDVVQSGIIGSLALCLPNAQEGIYVPVCLTGVKAGIDSLNSVLHSYQSCLEENLATGQTVGICDQMHSVYMCEFFWRQGFPLAKVAVPKILKIVTGQNTRGGGEYQSVEKAWKATQDSVKFFTQFYATNTYKAFRARGQDQIGSEVCNNFISMAYPEGQGLLDAVKSGQSPPQFNANFDVIPLTSKTNPPTSQYKVYYHIFAGNDRGAYFRVYLRGAKSSYFQDTGSGRIVDSGYINSGQYASETVDFTAPEGFQEICVRVNEDERCGFGKVSTSFSANFIEQNYLKKQALADDIETEKACVSGTASLTTMLNLNVQAGAESLISPEIYNKGIIRTCATQSPGLGNDPSDGTPSARWQEVGYCGDKNLKCWLDRNSVADSMNNQWKTYDDFVNQSTEAILDQILASDKYFTEAEFDNFVERNLTEIDNFVEIILKERIGLIEGTIPKVYLNYQKGKLYLERAETYSDFAKYYFVNFVLPELEKKRAKEASEESMEGEECDVDSDCGGPQFICVDGLCLDVGIEGNGHQTQTVSGVVESKGYVSPDFSFDDGNVWSRNPCFRYNSGTWETKSFCGEMSSGWVNVSKTKTLSPDYDDMLVTFDGANFLMGLKAMMQKVVKNDLRVIPNNADLDVIDVANFNHDRTFYSEGAEIYYKYDDKSGKWFWSGESTDYDDLKNWNSVEYITQTHLEASYAGLAAKVFLGSTSTTGVDLDSYEMNSEALKISWALRELNLQEGAAIILGAVKPEQLNELVYNPTGMSIATAVALINQLNATYGDNARYGIREVGLFISSLVEEKLISEAVNDDFMENNRHILELIPLLKKIEDEGATPDGTFEIPSDIEKVCASYLDEIRLTEDKYNLPKNLLLAVAYQESKCNPNAISSTGAVGLMQFTTGAAYDYGLCEDKKCIVGDKRKDGSASIDAAARYFINLFKIFDNYPNQLEMAVASYNGGQGLIKGASDNALQYGKTDSWADAQSMLFDVMGVYSPYDKWSDEQRKAKVKEITDYVKKVTGIMKGYIEGEKMSETEKRKNNFEKALEEIEGMLDGNYNNYKVIVDRWESEGLLLKEQLDYINGGTLRSVASMKSVKNILKMNYLLIDARTPKIDLDKAFDILYQLKGDYDDNELFIRYLHEDGLITDDELDDLDGNFLGTGKGDLDDVEIYLKKRQIEEKNTPNKGTDEVEVVRKFSKDDSLKLLDEIKADYDSDPANPIFIQRADDFFSSMISGNMVEYDIYNYMGLSGKVPEFDRVRAQLEAIEEEPVVCEKIEPSKSASEESVASLKVIAMVEELIGEPRHGGSCYEAVEYVYQRAGVSFEKCYYSDATGKTYPTGAVTQSSSASKSFYVNPNCQIRDRTENQKLNGIDKGDLLDFYFDPGRSHNAIFIKWVNEEERVARVFDWNGEGRTYGYNEFDLSDNAHPVYMYRKPFLP